MKLKQHLMIGEHAINWIDAEGIKLGIDFSRGINRLAYLLGSISPDINCVYPAHRIKTTFKRYKLRIKLESLIHNQVLKSYLLGIITHYTCDYFCYAHNNESAGYHHKRYEKELIKTSIEENEFKGDYRYTNNRHMGIADIVEALNKEYIDKVKVDKHVGWDDDKEQCKVDLKYADRAVKGMLYAFERQTKDMKSVNKEKLRVDIGTDLGVGATLASSKPMHT